MSEETKVSNELTAEEAQAFRAEMAENEWGDEAGKIVEPPEELGAQPVEERLPKAPVVEDNKVEPEPVAEVAIDPALKTVLDGITSKLDTFGQIENRLKQAESRIGSVTNAVHNQTKVAEEAAKVIADAPDKEQIAAAAKSDEDWKQLKVDYPEHADLFEGLEQRFAARGEIPNAPDIPDMDSMRGEITTDIDSRVDASAATINQLVERRLVDVMRPGWRQKVQGADGRLIPEYVAWYDDQDAAMQTRANSDNAEDAIYSYDAFMASQKNVVPKETPEQIQAKRDERLNRSQTITGTGKPIKTKSVEDMTDEEYRAHLVAEGD